jgi:hypothetical protein
MLTRVAASVQLTGAQLDEAQNGGADLRLNVADARAPGTQLGLTAPGPSLPGRPRAA